MNDPFLSRRVSGLQDDFTRVIYELIEVIEDLEDELKVRDKQIEKLENEISQLQSDLFDAQQLNDELYKQLKNNNQ